jgi:hypothetical protein
MLDFPLLENVPSEAEIAELLERICVNPRSWYLLESARELTGLACTRPFLPDPANEEHDYAEAVRHYLNDVVPRVESEPDRLLLEVVLGVVDPRWRGRTWRNEPVEARREEAGRQVGGEQPIGADEVRDVLEPQALARLATVIRGEEERARA